MFASSFSALPYLGSAHRVFNLRVLRSCASSLCTPRVFLFNLSPPQFSFSSLSVSTDFYVIITTSSSVFLSTWPNHFSLASIIFSLLFSTQVCPSLKPLSQWEISSGHLELPRYKSTVKAICFGLANSANYSDQWSDATLIRCKLHCER